MDDSSNVLPLRSVTRAAASGSRRELLVALRDRLWTALEDDRTQPRDLSPLSLRLKELHAEIAAIDEQQGPEAGPKDEPFDYDSI